MVLRRVGNKKKLSGQIVPLLPPHDIYIEMFFGAGGIFFNKPRAQYNFINDLDDEVYNLWNVVMNDRAALLEVVELMPYDETLFKQWTKERPIEPTLRAARFLMLSNWSYLGGMNTLKFKMGNDKAILIHHIKTTIFDNSVKSMNVDFRKVLGKISFKSESEKQKAFIYADPPYLGTTDTYSSSFTKQDSEDLFNVLVGSGIRFAMSEYNHPFILQQAEKHNLNVIVLGEKQTLKSRQTEILITNYEAYAPTLF